jgi:hypothetical protein
VPPNSILKKNSNEETPEKQSMKKKKTKRVDLVDDESGSLPPIHHFRFDFKLNFYSTVKPQENVFKKTHPHQLPERKKGTDNYQIIGRKV